MLPSSNWKNSSELTSINRRFQRGKGRNQDLKVTYVSRVKYLREKLPEISGGDTAYGARAT
jgi:hypothetical protein